MAFRLPAYTAPDFAARGLANAPFCRFAAVKKPGVAPDEYHATSVFPEYLHVKGRGWVLAPDSRMDAVPVLRADKSLDIVEFRRLQQGDLVALGRTEDGQDGIFVHTDGFDFPAHTREKFAFRTSLTRETSFSIDYDELFELLEHERRHGFTTWVLGPAVVFDSDSRAAFSRLIEAGYVDAILAGNALATHDLEGALYGTALGLEIYHKRPAALGHYKHLDALNTVRGAGSIAQAVQQGLVGNGVMHAAVQKGIPFVLAGSIRDDGPLPEVFANVYAAQDAMRAQVRRATTVVCLATQLHTIATGNMTPSYRVLDDGTVRPVYFYSVDMSEFAASKLADRGSLTARPILTNVQDFVVMVERGLRKKEQCA
jgi:lysine-ketoglutarate reductase/saccharopine dehydrogenase-like protein (TIGR00300 family)